MDQVFSAHISQSCHDQKDYVENYFCFFLSNRLAAEEGIDVII